MKMMFVDGFRTLLKRADMIVQIYEVNSEAEAEELAEIGVDHIGSVITPEMRWDDPGVRGAVAVAKSCGRKSSLIQFFDDFETVSRIVDYHRPDILHFCEALHGFAEHRLAELLLLQRRIKERYPFLSIMRSIPIAQSGRGGCVDTLHYAEIFAAGSDYFLTDTLLVAESDGAEEEQPVSGFVGITGKLCDLDVAAKLVSSFKVPVVLAGGLSPLNVAEAVEKVRPFGVDSCTLTNAIGQEGRPVRFKKDMKLVEQFVRNAKKLF